MDLIPESSENDTWDWKSTVGLARLSEACVVYDRLDGHVRAGGAASMTLMKNVH